MLFVVVLSRRVKELLLATYATPPLFCEQKKEEEEKEEREREREREQERKTEYKEDNVRISVVVDICQKLIE